MNRLSEESSPYLRHAADQMVEWYAWGDEPFRRAAAEDRPVFLSSGAAWCHWCHVMAKESFYDPEIASILNNNFICIKLDRDERPDIDRPLQQAVAAMGGGGGWPLSVFLTPAGRPFWGGTYFPPEDAGNRPSFRRVLLAVVEHYANKKGELEEYADRLLSAIKQQGISAGEPDPSILAPVADILLDQIDAEYGGFGHALKFPMTAAISFLLGQQYYAPDEKAAELLKLTLDRMAAGGIYDQLQGGFHRYSTDQQWLIPHFEKMTIDNAWLLRSYLEAYSVLGEQVYLDTAKDIARFLIEVMRDTDAGFYSSQDADVEPEDEGGYFTWQDREFSSLLTADEYALLSSYYLHEKGRMHHNRLLHVLYKERPVEEYAEEQNIPAPAARALLESGRQKLLAARACRTAPFIDKTIYANLNGLTITSLLQLSRISGEPDYSDKALQALELIWAERYKDSRLFHSAGVDAMLDDYIFLSEALLTAYEHGGDRSYLTRAEELMAICIEQLWDAESGGFFDATTELSGIKTKSLEDTPHASGNTVAIELLLKLSAISGREQFSELAHKALRSGYGRAADAGVHRGSYYSALQASVRILRLEVHADPGSALAQAARSFYYPHLVIKYEADEGFIVPCLGNTCLEPIRRPEDINLLPDRLRQIHNS